MPISPGGGPGPWQAWHSTPAPNNIKALKLAYYIKSPYLACPRPVHERRECIFMFVALMEQKKRSITSGNPELSPTISVQSSIASVPQVSCRAGHRVVVNASVRGGDCDRPE